MSIIGTQIRDLKILSALGEGGMGVVYLAEHVRLGKKFAVKCLNPEMSSSSALQERFNAEAIAQARLLHPNIVQVTDFFEEKGHFYLLMEYVDGSSLDEIIDSEGMLPEKICLPFLKDILNGLNFAHSKGVIHRDIKPSNIIIDQLDRARIMDFGIAIQAGEKRLTKTGLDVGTAWYMSPEQVQAQKKIDYRTDVYSVGVVLYEMLSGQVPFDGESDYAVKNKHVNELPAHICLVNSNVSLELAGIVMKALEKDPDDRFDGCGEFLEYILAYEREKPSEKVSSFKVFQQNDGIAQLKMESDGQEEERTIDSNDPESNESTSQPDRDAESQTPETSFTDAVTGMEFLHIPGGRFLMGDIFGDGDRNERPVREIEVSSFHMGKTPVTQGQWKSVMGSNPSRFNKGDSYPVEMVSWEEAQKFIRKLTRMNNRKYQFRLPTEAEWEFAARSGGKDEKYAGGNTVEAVAWYDENSGNSTHPVGEKEPNGLGLHDMSGNVWEWCRDWFSPYSSKLPLDDAGAPADAERTLRGGSWDSNAATCRSTSRYGNWPKYRDNNWGFRLVVDMEAPEPLQGNLRIASTPKGASIWLDGMNTLQETDAVMDMRAGKYKVTLRLDGYEDAEREVEVSQFDISEVDIRIEQKQKETTKAAIENIKSNAGPKKSGAGKISITVIALVCAAVFYGGYRMLFQDKTGEKPAVTPIEIVREDESPIEKNDPSMMQQTQPETTKDIVSAEPSASISSPPGPEAKLGCVWGNCTNGFGTYVFRDGSKYTGTFKRNNFHGEGTFSFADGKQYVGQFYGGKREGTGTLTYLDGSKYTGDFIDGEPHGQGLLTIPKVGKFKGKWRRGSPYGKGTLFSFDGRTYKGQYKDVMAQQKAASNNQTTVRPKPPPKIVVVEKPAVPETFPKKKEPDHPNKPIETSDYVSYQNGILKDKRSGLEWCAGPDKDSTFIDAESWVKRLHSFEGGGWRLPTLEELKALYKMGSGRFNITPFLKTSGWKMWAAPEESQGPVEGGRYFNFSYGVTGWGDSRHDSNARVLAVRTAQSHQ